MTTLTSMWERDKERARLLIDNARMTLAIKDAIEALERDSTSAPVLECLRSALTATNREYDSNVAPCDDAKVERLRADKDVQQPDSALFRTALGVLHRMATENTGWRSIFFRWYYSDEPLRNDAADIVRAARFEMPMPEDTRLLNAGAEAGK